MAISKKPWPRSKRRLWYFRGRQIFTFRRSLSVFFFFLLVSQRPNICTDQKIRSMSSRACNQGLGLSMSFLLSGAVSVRQCIMTVIPANLSGQTGLEAREIVKMTSNGWTGSCLNFSRRTSFTCTQWDTRYPLTLILNIRFLLSMQIMYWSMLFYGSCYGPMYI